MASWERYQSGSERKTPSVGRYTPTYGRCLSFHNGHCLGIITVSMGWDLKLWVMLLPMGWRLVFSKQDIFSYANDLKRI